MNNSTPSLHKINYVTTVGSSKHLSADLNHYIVMIVTINNTLCIESIETVSTAVIELRNSQQMADWDTHVRITCIH